MRKKKITVALFAGRYEGKVTSVSELILGLDENRFDTMFIYLSGYGADGNLTEKIGRRFFYLSDRKQIKTFKFSILRRLARILKEQKVDIIHSQSHKCTVYGTLAAIIARTPVVLAHVHGLGRSRN
ncbi:MAG: glycosyltransferase, partial [Planctomycetota bacterium]|nr:glycosyltransferase [Planctomycetota bacterium]